RHTRFSRDWSSDVCSSDLVADRDRGRAGRGRRHHGPAAGQAAPEREPAVGRREDADGARTPGVAVPGPSLAVLPPRRGGRRARRRERRALQRDRARHVLAIAVPRHHPHRGDDRDRRRAVRGDDGGEGRLEGGLRAAAGRLAAAPGPVGILRAPMQEAQILSPLLEPLVPLFAWVAENPAAAVALFGSIPFALTVAVLAFGRRPPPLAEPEPPALAPPAEP